MLGNCAACVTAERRTRELWSFYTLKKDTAQPAARRDRRFLRLLPDGLAEPSLHC
jgi:hypothetical protein